MVALFDSRVPRRGWVEIDGELRQLTRLGRGRRRMRRFGADLVYGMRYSWYSMRGVAAPPALARIRQIRSSSQAFEAYRPAPLDQKVVFFAALGSGAGGIPGAAPSDEEWRNLATTIEVVAVPGKHTGDDSLLAEPNVEVLADEFSVRITRLEQGADRPSDGRLVPRAREDAPVYEPTPGEAEHRSV
jgi:hypothetical protein